MASNLKIAHKKELKRPQIETHFEAMKDFRKAASTLFKPRNDVSSSPACGLSSSVFHQAMDFLADASLHEKQEKKEVPIYSWTRIKTKSAQQIKQNTTAPTDFKPRGNVSPSPACDLSSGAFHQAMDFLADATLHEEEEHEEEEKQEVPTYCWTRIKTKSAQQIKRNTMDPTNLAPTNVKRRNGTSPSSPCGLSSSVFHQAMDFSADASLHEEEEKQEVLPIYCWTRIKTKSVQQIKHNIMDPTNFKHREDVSPSPACCLSSSVFHQAMDFLADATLHEEEEKQEVPIYCWTRIKAKSAQHIKRNTMDPPNLVTMNVKSRGDVSSSPACDLSSSIFHQAMDFSADASLHEKEEKQEVPIYCWTRIKTKSAQQIKRNTMDPTNLVTMNAKPKNGISPSSACGLSSSVFHQVMDFSADASLHEKEEKQVVPIYCWTRIKTKSAQQIKHNAMDSANLTPTHEKENNTKSKRAIVDELKGVLSSKRARRKIVASIFDELIGRFVIREMDTKPKQRPIVSELNKVFLMKKLAVKKSNTPNDFDERTPAIAVIQGLLKRNALKELRAGRKKSSKMVLGKLDPVIQEVLARRKKQSVVKEFNERSNFCREMHEKANAVIHELSMKFVLRELTVRAKDKEEWCEKSDMIINDLDYRFALRELSESFTAKEELQEKLSCVVQGLTRKFMVRELKARGEEKAIDRDIFLGNDAHMAVQYQLLKNFLIQDLHARARALEEFHCKTDLVLQDLKDRFEWVETQEFKQLVIQDLADRSEALQEFQEKSSLVHVELLKKFVLHDLKERSRVALDLKEKTALVLDELNEKLDWVSVHEPNHSAGMMDWVEVQHRTEWDICNDDF